MRWIFIYVVIQSMFFFVQDGLTPLHLGCDGDDDEEEEEDYDDNSDHDDDDTSI